MNYCKACSKSFEHKAETTGGYCWECNDRLFFSKYLKTLPPELKATVDTKPSPKLNNEQIKDLVDYNNQVRHYQLPSMREMMKSPFDLVVDLRPAKLTGECTPESGCKTTLPIDSAERKNYPLFRGLLRYFPAALAGVANTSQKGNDKHNPGKELHHARSKSGDHGDCVLRHLMDLADLLAARDRGAEVSDQQILDEVNSASWRVLALSQELHESLGSPLAPGAKE